MLERGKIMAEYKHINDCWAALEDCKTIEDFEAKFEEFPRWSGDWEVSPEEGEGGVYVRNRWFDKDLQAEDEREEFFEVDFDSGMIEDCLEAIEEMLRESKYADFTQEIHNAEDFKDQFFKCYKFAADEMAMDRFFWENYKKIYEAWKAKGFEDEWNDNADDLNGDEFDQDFPDVD